MDKFLGTYALPRLNHEDTENLNWWLLGRRFGEGNGTPLQYSCLENPMGGGAWWAAVHGVAGSWARLNGFIFTFHFHALEKEMAPHSSVLAWRIPGMGEPGGLPSMGSHRVRHDWSDSAAAGYIYRRGERGSMKQSFERKRKRTHLGNVQGC